MLKYPHVCQPANVASPAGAGFAENRKFSYQPDTRQISITNWKGPISNEPFNHSHPSTTTAAKSVKKHHPGLAGIPRKLHPFERSEIFSEVPIYRERAGARFIRLPPSASASPASRFTLHASRASRRWRPLHLSRTLYKSALFMQNKPNLLNTRINVTSFLAKHYEDHRFRTRCQNKPNPSPIKSNLQPCRMNLTFAKTKRCENNRPRPRRENKPNQTKSNPRSRGNSRTKNSQFRRSIAFDRLRDPGYSEIPL